MLGKYNSRIIPKSETEFEKLCASIKSFSLGRHTSWGYKISRGDFCVSIYTNSSTINVSSMNQLIEIGNMIFSHITKEFYVA